MRKQERDSENRDVLIPSSSGLRLESYEAKHNSVMVGLNPFFIRSAVGIVARHEAAQSGAVLIPSSSGLRLEYNTFAHQDFILGFVLIPSSSGLRLECIWTVRMSRPLGS